MLIPVGLPIAGAILSDQVKNLNWRARNAELICALLAETTSEVLQKLATLLSQQTDKIQKACRGEIEMGSFYKVTA